MLKTVTRKSHFCEVSNHYSVREERAELPVNAGFANHLGLIEQGNCLSFGLDKSNEACQEK